MARLRTAASVLLTRGAGREVEVFLVERSPELAFFGGYWSLPGGAVDAADRAGGADEGLARRRAAARELFEEAGVLVAPLAERVARGERAALRRALLAGEAVPDGWSAALHATGAELAGLVEVLAITTPAFAPVRFETSFLHVPLPSGEVPEVWPGELVRGELVRPAQAIDEWRRGVRPIAPPVLFLLELLSAARGELAPFVAAARRAGAAIERGRLHPVRHTPGVFTAPLRTPTVPPATTTNCHVVGEDELWIVDPATYEDEERERLCTVLDERRAGGARLAGILVTHHHQDHVGSVAALSRRYDLEVRGHPLTLARLPGEWRRGAPLADKDELALGTAPDGSPGWKLRALHTPGHDRGHLAFLESRYGALLAGDLVSTLSTIVIDPPEGHMATYLASLARCLEEPLGAVHPAHGMARLDGQAVLRRYVEHRRAREEQLVAALGREPRAAAELLPEVYSDVVAELLPLAARSLAAGLEKLAEEGRAREQAGRWRLVAGGAA